MVHRTHRRPTVASRLLHTSVAMGLVLALVTPISTAWAQESEPGDSCAGIATGAFRQSAGDGTIGHILICDGTNWQPLLSHNNDGEATKIGNQACGNGDVLTYNSTIWTCGAGGGGSSLWEEAGGALRPTSSSSALPVTLHQTATASSGGVAWGNNTNASGPQATAWGAGSIASGVNSTAWGDSSSAISTAATAWGMVTTASSSLSTAWGEETAATGSHSTAWGMLTAAGGMFSTAWGTGSNASAQESTAWGNSAAAGVLSTAWGIGHAGSYLETSLGRYPLDTAGNAANWVATDTLFEIGNGASSAARANALTLLKNGDFVVGSHSLDDVAGGGDDMRMFFDKSQGAFRAGYAADTYGSWNAVSVGSASAAFGQNATASGERSMAWGLETNASGEGSTAWGGYVSDPPGPPPPTQLPGGTASGTASTAWGRSTASGQLSTAWGGSTASGETSTAWGSASVASGVGSTAWGLGSHAGAWIETSLGRYPLNTAGTATSWVATDTLFEIGNGASSGARANAVTVLKNGYVAIGNITPNVALDVDGDIEYTGIIADVSDSRLKTKVEELSPHQGDAIGALKPVAFEMKDREGVREFGFIAQDVEQVFPELVQESAAGVKSINYVGLIAPMVKAIQQLQEENAALRARIEAIEGRSGAPATSFPPQDTND